MENRGDLSRKRVRRQERSVVEPTKRTDLLKLIKERMAQEDGWKLIEDVDPLLDRFQGSIETIGFLQAGEKFIEYKELLDRAKQLGAHYGGYDAQYVYDHQKELLARDSQNSPLPVLSRYVLDTRERRPYYPVHVPNR